MKKQLIAKCSLTAMSLVALLVCGCFIESANGQTGFNKSGRSPAHGSSAFGSRGNGSQIHGHSGGGNRGGGNRGNYNQGGNRGGGNRGNINRGGNRTFQGTGHRNSLSHFHGTYVPINPYGFGGVRGGLGGFNSFGVGLGGLNGFGGSVYYGSYPVFPNSVFRQSYGANFNNFNNLNAGLNTRLNPAYSTYGSFLGNQPGVAGSSIVGSSIAAREFQRLQELQQQQRIEANFAAANDRERELMRLQLELETARAMLERERLMKPPIPPVSAEIGAAAPADPAKQAIIDQLGVAPVIEASDLAAETQLKAERAFRSGDYGQAARFAGLATSLDESDGKLKLFAAQAHFANAEFAEATSMVAAAAQQLEPVELGWVVENFKLFYGQNDFVTQTRSLSSYLNQNPTDASAWLLRGYQYGALGYPDAAKTDLAKAKELGFDAAIVDVMLQRFAP